MGHSAAVYRCVTPSRPRKSDGGTRATRASFTPFLTSGNLVHELTPHHPSRHLRARLSLPFSSFCIPAACLAQPVVNRWPGAPLSRSWPDPCFYPPLTAVAAGNTQGGRWHGVQ